MFFMMGITDGRKNLDYNQTEICSVCGRYGRFQVFMTYTVLSLFFIPCFKWNRHYYVQTSCCHTLYELDREIGRRIERGEDVRILPEHLQKVEMVDRGITMVVISVARIVGMRQPKTLCFARNAVCGCNGNCAA